MPQGVSLDQARRTLRQHRTRLLEQYHAVGVGIGGADDGSYTIVVYLETDRDVPTEAGSIEGVPVRFEVTGRFRKL